MSIYKQEDELEPQQQQQQERDGDVNASSTASAAATALSFPPLTHASLEKFAFSSWYPSFRTLSIKSKIIALPEDFVDYLNADGVFIPGQTGISYALSDSEDDEDEESDMERLRAFKEGRLPPQQHRQRGEDSDDDDDDDNEAEQDDKEAEAPIPYFPGLELQITQAIDSLGGEVFPKLNWSSPRDASWIAATNTLKCHNVADIFLLLKSSDFVAHDLAHAYEDCADEAGGVVGAGVRQRPETVDLVLRKWYDLAPSMEFRCFVRDGELVGISQRDMTYYEFLAGLKDELEEKIVTFFEDKILGNFTEPSYTFDVYITRNRERIYLIDFNPFAQKTDSLLYEWEELLLTKEPLPLRLLASEAAGRHMHQPFSFNRYPKDVTDLSNGQTVADFAEAFYKKVQASAK
ncbi:hypothetical protein BGZ99_005511 [Dissophora globulifera]|uniref:Cell division cycle protein 123 n=1 Tax=Dissophora globulifera TaxID=979702 RepID=A0A9P6RJ37_9FUNG|nr:hypothetical protein BGZ99_005511 [Dissophora globulifera]